MKIKLAEIVMFIKMTNRISTSKLEFTEAGLEILKNKCSNKK